MTNTEIEHENTTNGFVCPHCGHIHDESWGWTDEGATTCNLCEKEFGYNKYIEIYYSTEKLEDEETEEE